MTILNITGSVPVPTPTSSGTFSFTVTRDQIIRQAMLDIGALGEAENPTSQEASDCAFKLNMLVKQWMGRQDFAPGLKMWTRQRGDLFLGATKFQYALGPTGDNFAAGLNGGSLGQTFGQTTTTASVSAGIAVIPVAATTQLNVNDYIGVQCGSDIFWSTIASIAAGTSVTLNANLTTAASSGAYVWNYTTKGQRPLAIVTSVLRDINQNDTPQTKMTIEEYEALPTKTNTTFQSDPASFYYESQIPNGMYYLDVGGAQDVTKHLHIVYLQPVQDFDNPGDAPEYPQQWYRALCWGLGRDIAGMFDCEWTNDMQANLQDSLSMAREADSETTAAFFEPGRY